MGATIYFFSLQLWSSTDLINQRVAISGVHTIAILFFCASFFLFYFIPLKDLFRAAILVLYSITIHETLWNVFYYGFVQPNLFQYFLYYSMPTISVMIFTLVISIKKYWGNIWVPTILTLISGAIYEALWLSIGFPITIATFENPVHTIYFKDQLVNLIEVGEVLSFHSTFMASYLIYNLVLKKMNELLDSTKMQNLLENILEPTQ